MIGHEAAAQHRAGAGFAVENNILVLECYTKCCSRRKLDSTLTGIYRQFDRQAVCACAKQ